MATMNVLLSVQPTAEQALAAQGIVLEKVGMPADAWCGMLILHQEPDYQLIGKADTGCKKAIEWAARATEALAECGR